jgi:hypothetical protein
MGSFLTVNYVAAFFTSLNPVLLLGEYGIELDTGQFKVGDGSTAWNALPYGLPPSGGSNTAQAIVDFGNFTPEETVMRTTVAVPWVTPTTKFVCTVVAGQDHTADEIAAEQVTTTAGNIVAGVSFDVVVTSLVGSTGKFTVDVVGA